MKKKSKLFSNFTAHSGVITLKDGWGFSFQLERVFLFYNNSIPSKSIRGYSNCVTKDVTKPVGRDIPEGSG